MKEKTESLGTHIGMHMRVYSLKIKGGEWSSEALLFLPLAFKYFPCRCSSQRKLDYAIIPVPTIQISKLKRQNNLQSNDNQLLWFCSTQKGYAQHPGVK